MALVGDSSDFFGLYPTAAQGCLRAMCEDDTLAIVFDPSRALASTEHRVCLPAPANLSLPLERMRHRGLVDSHAAMRCFHNRNWHSRIAPTDPVAERLHTLFERERFEALAAGRYAGSAHNLNVLWTTSYSDEAIARFGGAEHLEWILSCLCREQLWNVPLSTRIESRIAEVRAPLDALIGEHIRALSSHLNDQRRYARQVLLLIEKLGFDVQAASDSDAKVVDEERASAEEAGERVDDSLQDQNSTDPASDEASSEDSEQTDSEEAVLVRNVERDAVEEPTLADMQQLSERLRHAENNAAEERFPQTPYRIYSEQADEIVNALDLVDSGELPILREQLDKDVEHHAPQVSRLASRLRRLLQARQRRQWLYDQEEGELDTRRLPRIITDPLIPLSFRVESDDDVRSTAVTILIDNSRSMLGRPIRLAAMCADVLTRTLERCGVANEVLGFTTVSMYGGASKAHWQQAGEAVNPGRLNSVRHIVYKAIQTPCRRARDSLAVMTKSEILKQNIDGEALMWAHQRLQKHPAQRRILIVISDGAPSDAATLVANEKDLLVNHLHSVVAEIQQHSAVELLAIGIGHDVSHYFDNAMVVSTAEELAPALLDELTDLLTMRSAREVQ